MVLALSIPYIGISVLYLIREYKKHFITPLLLFLMMQLIMYIGIVQRIDLGNAYHLKLVALYNVALIGVIIGAGMKGKYVFKGRVDNNEDMTENQLIKIVFWTVVSIVICFLFFYRVGTNAVMFLFGSGNGNSITELRRSINYTSGSGIVYQFRVFILPILMFILISSTKRSNRIIGIIIAPITMIYLLGSGQRGGLATVMLMYVVVFLYRNREIKLNVVGNQAKKGMRQSRKLIIIFLSLAFLAFASLTVANQRVAVNSTIMKAIVNRVFNDNQSCALIGFEYFVNDKIVFGYDWLMMTLALIPGVQTGYMPAANRIFEIIYGSTRGTSPLCIWGSAYYNFGVVGVLVLSVLIGYVYSRIGRIINIKVFSTVELILYAELVVVLGTWIAEGPYYLLNNGLLATLLLNWSLNKSHLRFSLPHKYNNR